MTRNTSLKSGLGCLAIVGGLLAFGPTTSVGAQDDRLPIAVAQSESAAQAKPAPKPLIPLKVTVVIARYQGEKKTGSLPFVLTVNAHDRGASLQMGAEVPYPQGVMGANSAAGVSYAYKTIGTNITCSATAGEDSRFYLELTVTDSQIFSDALGGAAALKGVPSFQNFTSRNTLLLRDGQTLQYSTAVDKSSGETIKLDVTLNVIK